MSGTKRTISEMEQSSSNKPKFVVFTADALIDGRKTIENVITKLFTTLKPEVQPLPTKSQIIQVFSKCPQPLTSIFSKLGVTFSSQAELDTWVALYCQFYFAEEVHLYDDAGDFLAQLRAHNIPVVILTSNPEVILALLAQAQLEDHVDLIVDQLARFTTYPREFRALYIPQLFARAVNFHAAGSPDGTCQMTLSDAMMVTCTPGLFNIAMAIESRTCWVKVTDGTVDVSEVHCDIVARSLAELGKTLFGSGEDVAVQSKIRRLSEEVDGESQVSVVTSEVNGDSEVSEVTNEANVESKAPEVIKETNVEPMVPEVTMETNVQPGVPEVNGEANDESEAMDISDDTSEGTPEVTTMEVTEK